MGCIANSKVMNEILWRFSQETNMSMFEMEDDALPPGRTPWVEIDVHGSWLLPNEMFGVFSGISPEYLVSISMSTIKWKTRFCGYEDFSGVSENVFSMGGSSGDIWKAISAVLDVMVNKGFKMPEEEPFIRRLMFFSCTMQSCRMTLPLDFSSWLSDIKSCAFHMRGHPLLGGKKSSMKDSETALSSAFIAETRRISSPEFIAENACRLGAYWSGKSVNS